MIKKILCALASIFLISQSYGFLNSIGPTNTYSWGALLFMAWVINLFITGIFAFPSFAFPVERLLPDSYYQISNPGKLKKIFRLLRVDWFKALMLTTIWGGQQRKKYFDGTAAGIAALEEKSNKSEFGHVLPFGILLLVSIYFVRLGSTKLALLTLLINIIGNLYPVILQRHHRMRIQTIRKLQERRAARS